jgi:hypothetical protein
MGQFEFKPLRPRRWPIPAQGWFNPGTEYRHQFLNPEMVRAVSNAFSVSLLFGVDPGLSLRSNRGLELANAFGVTRGTTLTVGRKLIHSGAFYAVET